MTSIAEAAAPPARSFTERAVWAVLRVSWKLVSFPLLALLIILEPVVRFLLAGLALLLVLTAFFWKLAAPPPVHAPFLALLAAAVGCIALLTLYQWLLRLLSV
jgi:hypothetical protein